MKIISILFLSLTTIAPIVSCSTTTVVKPEPTIISESVRRTTSTSTSGYNVPNTSSTTETRSVTTE